MHPDHHHISLENAQKIYKCSTLRGLLWRLKNTF